MNRRHFITATPVLLTLPALHPRQRRKTEHRVVLIGTGWYGKMDLFRLLQVAEVEVVGLCDVDSQQLDAAYEWLRERHPEQQPRRYADYREMLATEKPDIALIETPDHWHEKMALDCLAAGCHLYLQKPISRTEKEAKRILKAARKSDRTVQVALQRRSTPHLLEMKEQYLDSGKIGTIHHVEMSCYYHMRDRAVREIQEVPAHFNYVAWTGPAKRLPFRGIPHRRWRAFQEYGNGIVGDMCVHYFDCVRWLLGLGWPERISSTGGIYVDTEADANTTDTQTAIFEYPEHRLNVHWTHRAWGAAPDPDWPWSFTLYGEKGTLRASTLGYEWRPGKGREEDETVYVGATFEREAFPEDVDEKDIELHVAPAVRAHFVDFLEAIKTGRKPVADIEEAYISTVCCIRANELVG
ncbi:Gfo/Idh/MocA family protein [Lewinella sp. 4G2]|uniref:Gfo/Idh/MocA family protein n=1 Tax=Lewinella sp. 4G2 TaxID=1803372 RepID=UPI0007B48EF1|nr:Gfo/Idh/MocA family oxidoreductase [Lewinella sp. 4G2]OAV44093.1 oxidoreductase [Lewinella sp. 4G2]